MPLLGLYKFVIFLLSGIVLVDSKLDEFAVPTVLVTGVAKAGTTYLYALLRTMDDFHFKDRKMHHTISEKEFNVASRASRYMNIPEHLIPCPAETLANLMRCPAHVARRANTRISPFITSILSQDVFIG